MGRMRQALLGLQFEYLLRTLRENTLQKSKIPVFDPARTKNLHENKGIADVGSFKIHVILNKREFVCAFPVTKLSQCRGSMRSIRALALSPAVSATANDPIAAGAPDEAHCKARIIADRVAVFDSCFGQCAMQDTFDGDCAADSLRRPPRD
jgi:hypothetical protein